MKRHFCKANVNKTNSALGADVQQKCTKAAIWVLSHSQLHCVYLKHLFSNDGSDTLLFLGHTVCYV